MLSFAARTLIQGMTMNVGFIGLGSMGVPMAANLLAGGHQLLVWARRAAAAETLVARGATLCASPREVGAGADAVFTIVTTGADVEQVVLGGQGIAAGMKPGSVLVDCSTIPPATARAVAAALAAQQIDMLDAPVSGGEAGARAGTLSIMVGGKPEVHARMEPLLRLLGKTLVYVGDNGAGQVAKAANQLLLTVSIQAIAEAMTFAEANGVDFAPVREALMKGFAGSKMLELFGERMLKRQFEAGLDARLHQKDAQIVLQTAFESKTPVPAAALATQAFNALLARPGTRWDSAALLKVIAEASGRTA
jgi:2-hydroxy-3-oxopropionate reductase